MNVYFSGIGGVGLGPLAEIALDAGYGVVGSDAAESLVTAKLRDRGVEIEIGQDGSFLETCHAARPLDWFVYTAALPANHPELLKAKALGIRTAKRDELLAHIIAEKNLKLIAIAGTHGKTTTTGMMVWALKQLNVPLSYSVGTTLTWGPSGKFDPASEYFVYECDEFDRNFLHFSPYLSLITSVDYDHPDTYPTESDYLAAFREFGQKSRRLIGWNDQHRDLFVPPDGEHEVVLLERPAELRLAGIHNRRNASLVLQALRMLGFENADPLILENFPGTNRRFEKLAENLYSDYGHHPVEIAATLQLAREVSDHVVLVYQPHQNVRQHEIKNQYTDQFELAEKIYWLPTYLSREDPKLEILTPDVLTKNVTNKNALEFTELGDELWQKIEQHRQAGQLVLCMGAGSIDGWLRKKLS